MRAMDSSSYGREDNSVTFTTDMDNCMSVNDLQTCAGIGEVPDAANCPPHAAPCCPQWFVMRDLKRRNAKLPAYQQLADSGMEVFTPMMWQIFHKIMPAVRVFVDQLPQPAGKRAHEACRSKREQQPHPQAGARGL